MTYGKDCTDSSLKFHLQNAKNHGVTQKEIAAIITHVAFYAGWPKGWAVFNLAKAFLPLYPQVRLASTTSLLNRDVEITGTFIMQKRAAVRFLSA